MLKRLSILTATVAILACGVILLQLHCSKSRGMPAFLPTSTTINNELTNKIIDPSHTGIPTKTAPPLTSTLKPVEDHFAGIKPIAQRMLKPTIAGLQQRERLILSGGKYPIARVVDSLSTNPSTSQQTLFNQLAMVGDHVMVHLKNGHELDNLKSLVKQHGLSIRKKMKSPGCFLVSIEPATLDSVSNLTNILAAADCIDIAEPDYFVHIAETTPNDPSYSILWGMTKIEMPKVWDMTVGSNQAVVAVFDTGTDLDHADLIDNIWINPLEIAGNNIDDDDNGYTDDIYGWDFYTDENDPSDVYGHGSHVAGTIGAVGNNSLGVAGVNWNIKIMTIKFFGYNGTTLEGFSSDAMDGMYYVITHKTRGVPIRVTNHSWGGPGFSSLLKDSFEIAGSQGIMHAIAAGNNGDLNNDTHPQYPASFDLSNIVTVANTTSSDGLNSGSHYGLTSVDIGAPGTGIYSIQNGGGYKYMSGTSMASPHTAGVAALMFAYMPHLSWQNVLNSMLAGVDPISSLTGKCVTGGRLTAYGAFEGITPYIDHEPLDNTTSVTTDHIIDALIKPSIPFIDTNKVFVLWNTTGDTNSFSTNIMQHVAGDLFRGTIPGQSQGTEIYYMISVATKTGLTATDPTTAPATLHSFDVTYPVDITIYGLPGEYGTVDPSYGNNTAPWGSTVTATASLYTQPTNNNRFRCDGWYGGGDAPPTGTSNSVSFVITRTCAIAWNWIEQHALTQTSLYAINTVTWWDHNTKANSVIAPLFVESDGTNYAFVCWNIDGQRYPGPTNTAVNPISNLTMNNAKLATATYLPENQDNDLDGLPDWWEMYNFANLDSGENDDPDMDGFVNSAELADNSDPRDAASIPSGPVIEHTPLDDPMQSLSPWSITATVTDSSGVESVQLAWQRNSQPWTNIAMTDGGNNVYSSEIPSPHALNDNYTYYIQARDGAMNTSTTAWHTFSIAYPQITIIPESLSVELEPKTSTIIPITITNSGNATLIWQIQTNWNDSVSDNPNGWTHSGQNDLWHTTQLEVHSDSYAWYCGNDYLGSYENMIDATLSTPPITLGANPTFSFWHWAQFEYDGRVGFEEHYWDGAVVDVSTNEGVSFSRISPIGGYPHKITPNAASPFPDNTPCLGGTGGWEQVTFDLEDYAGTTVQVRFRFGSDEYSIDRGWFIDDIKFAWESAWINLSTTSGSVEAASSAELPVEINSTGLQLGQYNNSILLTCNDPTQPTLNIPVMLHVAENNDAHIAMDPNNPDAFIISWQADTSHTYSLMGTTNLNTDNWTGIPEYTNLPGINGVMSYTGSIDSISTQFYRVDELPSP